MENNVKQYDEHIKVTKEVTDEDIQRWKKLDELECSIHEVPKKKHRVGMKFWRIFGNTTGQIVLSILAILWVIPLFYLLVQSFRKEPGAWSPTFFPQEWTLDNYKRLFTETIGI